MLNSKGKSAVIEKLDNDRTQLRQAIDLVRNALFTGKDCNLPKETLDKLAEIGYI